MATMWSSAISNSTRKIDIHSQITISRRSQPLSWSFAFMEVCDFCWVAKLTHSKLIPRSHPPCWQCQQEYLTWGGHYPSQPTASFLCWGPDEAQWQQLHCRGMLEGVDSIPCSVFAWWKLKVSSSGSHSHLGCILWLLSITHCTTSCDILLLDNHHLGMLLSHIICKQ